mmetsp:Transcript_97711/g.164585  ORF Transcript_97711/g.164585 Transcript_97711/m.164585 type:complete len:83 (-) Transcript_97711:102-350(-)
MPRMKRRIASETRQNVAASEPKGGVRGTASSSRSGLRQRPPPPHPQPTASPSGGPPPAGCAKRAHAPHTPTDGTQSGALTQA